MIGYRIDKKKLPFMGSFFFAFLTDERLEIDRRGAMVAHVLG